MDTVSGRRPGRAAGAALLLASVGVAACAGPVAGAKPPAESAGKRPASQIQSPTACGRLSTRGTAIVCSDGTPFHWRGVTAFALLEQIAHGRRTDADAYMQWARATGFNLVRVLAMADVLFTLTPEEGRQHLAALFRMAAAHGLYVEIVALADTARFGTTASGLREQVAAVGAIAASHPSAVVQIANEHYHSTQSRELHDAAAFRALARLIPPPVLYTESAAAVDTATEPQGMYITRHLSRGGSPARMIERVRLLGRLAAEAGKPLVNGEPIGAAERDDPGRRLADPGFFRDLARQTSAAGLAGGTFHCEDGLLARIPGPVQQACARAWVEGASFSAPSTPRFP
jgi:hypothetical protein